MAELDRVMASVLRGHANELVRQSDQLKEKRTALRDRKTELQADIDAINLKLADANAEITNLTTLIDGLRAEADARQQKG